MQACSKEIHVLKFLWKFEPWYVKRTHVVYVLFFLVRLVFLVAPCRRIFVLHRVSLLHHGYEANPFLWMGTLLLPLELSAQIIILCVAMEVGYFWAISYFCLHEMSPSEALVWVRLLSAEFHLHHVHVLMDDAPTPDLQKLLRRIELWSPWWQNGLGNVNILQVFILALDQFSLSWKCRVVCQCANYDRRHMYTYTIGFLVAGWLIIACVNTFFFSSMHVFVLSNSLLS